MRFCSVEHAQLLLNGKLVKVTWPWLFAGEEMEIEIDSPQFILIFEIRQSNILRAFDIYGCVKSYIGIFPGFPLVNNYSDITIIS